MSNVRVAQPTKQRVRPAFTVQKLDGKRKKDIITIDAKGKRTPQTVDVDAGYLVSFPKGHSIRVATDDDLRRLGFDRTIELVDMESDEVVGVMPNPIAA